MIRISRCYRILFALLVLAAAGGCVNMERSEPERRFFALEAHRPESLPPTAQGPGLEVRPFRVSPRYDARGLVYRVGEVEYENDYYNRFLVPPGAMVTEIAGQWLERSGLFSSVVNASSRILPGLVVEGAVNRLYGDYRAPDKPAAVLEVQLFLIRSDENGDRIILNRTYDKRILLDGSGPEALIRAWNRGLEDILSEFEHQVRQGRGK